MRYFVQQLGHKRQLHEQGSITVNFGLVILIVVLLTMYLRLWIGLQDGRSVDAAMQNCTVEHATSAKSVDVLQQISHAQTISSGSSRITAHNT